MSALSEQNMSAEITSGTHANHDSACASCSEVHAEHDLDLARFQRAVRHSALSRAFGVPESSAAMMLFSRPVKCARLRKQHHLGLLDGRHAAT